MPDTEDIIPGTVSSDLNRIRQEEITGRLHDIRTVSVPPGLLDRLIAVEKYLMQAPCIPASAFQVYYHVVPDHLVHRVSRLQRFAESVAHLRIIQNLYHPGSINVQSIEIATRIYHDELQRLLGSMFPPEHAFWDQYHHRNYTDLAFGVPISKTASHEEVQQSLTRATGIYYSALDAMYFLAGRMESSSYQLITHSLKWALQAYYTPARTAGFDRSQSLRNAIQLIESVDAPAYRSWLVHQIHHKTAHVS